MARHRDTPSAEFISLHSCASSPWPSSPNPSREGSPVPEAPSTVTQKALDYRKQTWSLLLPHTIRWLGTVVFSVLLISVLWIYQSKGNFTRSDKNAFNIIVTGLSVGLGINFFVRFPLVAEPAGYSAYRATIDDVVNSKHDHNYYCSQDVTNPEFAYRYKEYNPGDVEGLYPLFTNRTITASAGQCHVYRVINERLVTDVDRKGPGKEFTYGNDTFKEQIQIPLPSLGGKGTTYMYKGIKVPDRTEHRCGPRCMWLWAFKNSAKESEKELNDREPPTFYKCPITISEVRNAWNDSHIVPNEVARIAAVSLALQGQWSGDEDSRNYNQYQFYPFGTAWETHFKTPRHVGANMAKFAISSIAEMAAANSRIQVQGLVPYVGSHLEIYWVYLVTLFMGIITTHLVLSLSAILASRKVAIKDDSLLATARLLQPLINVLGNEGTLLDGKELAKAIQNKSRGAGIVVGPMKNQGRQDGYHLDIGEKVPLRQGWPEHRHPAGKYI
ncbi:MAG: hypothetical protein Q9184_003737 [Pyrenodesmia sp. 2 TL-2023]